MAVSEKDRSILFGAGLGEVLEEENPIMSVPRILSSGEFAEEDNQLFSGQEIELMKNVEEALSASSGVRKVLESLYGAQGSVPVAENEYALLSALERVFGNRPSQITFEMYKQALDILQGQATELAKKVLI